MHTRELRVTETPAPSLRSLIAQWREYQATSAAEWRKAKERRDIQEATSRQAEARTLNVCAFDLETALAAQDAKLADLEAEMRRFAEAQRVTFEGGVWRHTEAGAQALAWAERLKALL